MKLRGQAQTEKINNTITVCTQTEPKFTYGKKCKMKHPAGEGKAVGKKEQGPGSHKSVGKRVSLRKSEAANGEQ